MAESIAPSSPDSVSRPGFVLAAMAASTIVSHALARSTFPLLLPAVESDLMIDRRQSGLLGSGNFAAYLAGVLVVTMVSGRVEPIRLLRTGLLLAAAGFLTLSVASGFPTLLAGQAVSGAASAAIWMSAPVMATRAAGEGRGGIAMGSLSSTMGLGLLVTGQATNLVRSVTGDTEAWRPTWVGAAIYSALVLAVVTLVIRTPPTEPVGGGISLHRLRSVPRWAVLAVAYWLFGLVVAAFPSFVGLLLKDQGFSPGHITNLYSLLGLAAVLGAVSLGWVSDRVGRRPVLAGAMAGIGAAALLVLIGREPFAAIAMALFGALSFTFPVLVVAYLRDHLEDRAFSNALGALTMFYGVSLMVGPAIAGIVADSSLGLGPVFAGLSIIAAAASLTATGLNGDAGRRPGDQFARASEPSRGSGP